MKCKIRIGFLINTIYSDYSTSFIWGLRKFCEDNNYELFIFPILHGHTSTRFDFQYDTSIDFITSKNIDVLIMASGTFVNYTTKEEFDKILEKISSIPKISAGMKIEGTPSIVVSSKKALLEAVTHLVKKHSRKSFMLMRANTISPESLEREEALKLALEKNGLEYDEKKTLNGSFIYEAAEQELLNYLKKKNNKPDFDAIFCCNDVMALGCIAAMNKVGINVPKDVSVIGYDNIFHADSSVITLTTIDQLTDEQAYRAGELAIDLLNKKNIPEINYFDAAVSYKESCGCPKEKNYKQVFKWRDENLFPQYKMGTEFDLLHYFYSESQEPISLERINSRLEYSLSLFNISNAIFVIYNEPVLNNGDGKAKIPQMARMEFCYSEKTGLKTPKTVFNPSKIIVPPEGKKFISKTQVVFPLSCGKNLYGYTLFSLGMYNLPFYQAVFELISKEVISSIKIMQDEHESRQLQDKNITLSTYSKKLYELSRKDELTGILNRRGFYEEAQNTIANAIANGKSGLVIYGDMDGLKNINDTFGHDAGDRAIKKEAEILQKIFRSTDIIGRLGGDEFGIVIPDIQKVDFTRIKKSLKEKCDEFNNSGEEKFILSISTGCTEFSAAKKDLDKLLMTSDKLLYNEKKRKKSATSNSSRQQRRR